MERPKKRRLSYISNLSLVDLDYVIKLEKYCDYLESLLKDGNVDMFKIVNHNSEKDVINLVIEECSELIKELTKVNRGLGDVDNIIEEMADVYNVMKQLSIKLEIEPKLISKKINEKMKRTIERLGL